MADGEQATSTESAQDNTAADDVKTEAASTDTLKPSAPAKAEKPASEKPQKPAPPEKYDLKLPDGSLLDQDALGKTASYAKERGLSNEEAQELLNQRSQAVEDHVEAVKSRSQTWVDDSRNDKEIGGEAFQKNVELAKRVVDKYGTEKFKSALNESGLGNHPEVIRVFLRIGKQMAEDSLVVPGAAAKSTRNLEDIFYPKQTTKES